jgi:hypothetical protein
MDDISVSLDHDTVEALQRRASQSGRTVSEEITSIVKDDVAGRLRPVDFVEWSRRIRAMSRQQQVTDSLELLREDRNR